MTNELNGLNKIVAQVREFHTAFGHPASDIVKPIDLDRATSRSIWTAEEAQVEFLQQSSKTEEDFIAAYDKLIAGLEKAKEKSLAMPYPKNETDMVVGQSDALIDACYFIAGSFVEMGIEPQALFDIVQGANMAKLGPDGKPIIRESDGKIMKPEGWVAPEERLEAEVVRQISGRKTFLWDRNEEEEQALTEQAGIYEDKN